jgi:trans-aconitate 2-methyltransferase
MTGTSDSVSTFYDSYGADDFKKGCNERHMFLYEKLINLGMKADSSVLELGCGAGIITKLISRTVTSGKIIASDISPKSIAQSKSYNTQSNIEFDVSDVVEFRKENTEFDFITLFDIMEHVPQEGHLQVFQNISAMMGKQSKLVVHVPTYENIKYAQNHFPDKLQIIDQPLRVEDIVNKAAAGGLRLEHMVLSNIWHKYDYQLFIFGLDKPYMFEEVRQKKKTIFTRGYNKVFKK